MEIKTLVHAGNVPLVYNPVTTHITLQFHVVYYDQFSTVNASPSDIPNNFYETLYNKARWVHDDKYADTDDLYFFDSFWSDLLVPPQTVADNRGRKKSYKGTTKHISDSHIGDPTTTKNGGHATTENGEHATTENGDNATTENGEHATTENGEHTTANISEHAHPTTNEHVSLNLS